MDITFSEERHEYKIDGQIVLSVTQVLKAAKLIDDTWYTKKSCQRGIDIHDITALIDSGITEFESYRNHEYYGYLEAWEKFKDDTKFEAHQIEYIVGHKDYRYAGTLDRLGMMNNEYVIIDIKTGQPSKVHGLQLTGYEECINNTHIVGNLKLVCVHLKINGTYNMIEYKNEINVFLSALNIARWYSK